MNFLYRVFNLQLPTTLAPGESQTVHIDYAPIDETEASGCIEVHTNDPVFPVSYIDLFGIGHQTQADINLSIDPLNFGTVVAGQTATLTTNILNSGDTALHISSITGCTANSVFSASPLASTTIAAGAQQMLSVAYSPIANGSTGNSNCIEIHSNDSDTPIVVLNLSGTIAIPAISLSSSSLSFGKVDVGAQSTLMIQVINNSTTKVLDIVNIVGCTPNSMFSALPMASTTIMTQRQENLAIRFSPLTTGTETDCIEIHSSDPVAPVLKLFLDGEGVVTTVLSPNISVSPLSLNFGSVDTGSSASLDIVISNDGDSSLLINAATACVGTVTEPEFSYNFIAPVSLAAGSNTTLSVTYAPTVAGTHNSCLTINSNDPDEPAIEIPISGDAHMIGAADIHLSTAALLFSANVDASDTQSFLIENRGDYELFIHSVELCSTTSSEFSLLPATFPVSSIVPGNSITVDVLYTPADAGTDQGCLRISSDDSDESVVEVTLTGTANPLPIGTASMGNFVWDDLNTDGIQSANEPGLPGVVIQLQTCSGIMVDSKISGPAGAFSFAGIAAGSYQMRYLLPADYHFSQTQQGSNYRFDSNADPVTGLTPCLSLSDGQQRLAIDAGMIADNPVGTGVLGDYVWEDLNGNGIQDANETGFENIDVNLMSCSGALLNTMTTDVNGAFSFSQLAPGSYQLHYVLPTSYQYSPANQGSNYRLDSNANVTSGLSPCLTIANGQQRLAIDAGMKPVATSHGTAGIGNFVWRDSNRDGIQNATETGLSGVTIELLSCSNTVIQSITTNSKGGFLFDRLTAGQYRLRFTLLNGYTFSPVTRGGDYRLDSNADKNSGLSPCLTMENGQQRFAIDAGMIPKNTGSGSAKIGNYVWKDTNGNGIQNANESGLPGVKVTLLSCSNTFIKSTTTNSKGGFVFNQLVAGKYRMRFTLPNGYIFSPAGKGGNFRYDSNANTNTGLTPCLTVANGQQRLAIDAGMVP